MNLAHYFENTPGTGILATADEKGNVDAAIYCPPQVVAEDTIALDMLDRLSYKNLQKNPHACYMFIEPGDDYQGRRFYITKVSEEPGAERIRQLKAEGLPVTDPNLAVKKFVCFRVHNIRPLVGDSY